MEWSDELVTKLTELWKQGLSTAEIGRQLSITKNAVVGKAHRIGLPGRPSPIRKKKAAGVSASKDKANATSSKKSATKKTRKTTKKAPAAAKKKAATTKPASKKKETASPLPTQTKEEKASPPKKKAPEKKPEPKAAPATPTPKKAKASAEKKQTKPKAEVQPGPRMICEWPFGDPGDEDFHFCGHPSLPGKPYCEEHAKVAYVRLRDKKE